MKQEKIIQQCKPALVSVMKKEDCLSLQAEFPSIRFVYGEEGLVEVATHPSTEVLSKCCSWKCRVNSYARSNQK